jgi:phosphopantetheine--protein transferase-like protein
LFKPTTISSFLQLSKLNASKYEKFAIGNDIVFLPQFKQSLSDSFIKKVYAPEELNYITAFNEPLARYASTFAAKEAIYKALKQLYPSLKISWKQIIIRRNKNAGTPNVDILQLGITDKLQLSLSITHDGDYVWAVVIIV